MRVRDILNSIWNEFVYGGHLLSLGAAGVSLSVLLLLNKEIEWPILFIIYLISQIGYNFNHFQEIEKDIKTNPERAEHLQKIKRYILFLFLIYILFLIFFLVYFANLKIFFFVLFLFSAGILYTNFLNLKSLSRKIVGFKNIYTSFFWALGTVGLPFLYYSLSFNLAIFFISLFIFFRLVLNTAFFDFKDIESDKAEKLLTLPAKFGEKKTLQILHFFNAISLFPLFFGVFLRILPVYSLSLLIFYFYSFYYLKKAEKIDEQSLRKLSYLMVDGEYIFWPIVLFLVKSLI